MVVLNYTGGEINAKIVYYGPGVSGKTTNLEYIHEKTPNNAKGKMVSMKTQTDRTLFFDFLPLELGEINGYRTRFLLYTVPGQVYYNATRKLVLKGVDAVVFVADSSRAKLDENLESLRNLEQNLNEHGLSLDDLPWVIQYNKRDLPDALPVAELEARLNPFKKPSFEAMANKGTGVYETFHGIATMVYRVLKDRLEKGELATEVGTAAPTMEAKRAARPQAPPAATPPPARPTRPTTTPAQSPAPTQRAPRTPAADANEGGFEFDDHVDLMLREVDAPSAPAKPAAPVKARPGTPVAPPRAHAPAPAPGKPLRPGDVIPTKTPARVPGEPTGGDAAGDDLFASIPSSPFDHELGRVPALDEASIASEEARAEGPDEFVTDPMRRSEPKPAPAPAPAPAAPPAPREVRLTPAAPVARETRVAADPNAQDTRELRVKAGVRMPTSTVDEVRIEVPVMLTRSQLDSGAPIRIVLNVKVLDD
jgi:signal recognition particle receptor subunit beta